MEVKNNIQIFDDEGTNIHNELCVFKYTNEVRSNPLDDVYGVSGAEIDHDKDLIQTHNYVLLGCFDQNTNVFTDIHGRRVYIDYRDITSVKIVDVEKLIK